MTLDVIKVVLPAIIAFLIGILMTPTFSNFLYKNEMWKKKIKSKATDGRDTPIFSALHKDKEIGTPRMGGVLIWSSAFFTAIIFWLLAKISPFEIFSKMEFISRDQTWIPFFALLVGAGIGLIDDYLEIIGSGKNIAGGLSYKKRLTIVAGIGILVSTWFYLKLDVASITIPFWGEMFVGWLLIPIFTIIIILVYSGGVIDGLDGLSGGVFASMFTAYAIIAFSLNQINLATFCMVLVGGILAFLWFNIPPARFYMSETGSMALTITLAIVALMTDTLGGGIGLSVLFIISAPLLVTAFSSFIQLASKKFRGGKKIFLSAPLHHHFEALGWPAYKVTMRYWIISIILSAIGIIIFLMHLKSF
jgi:phospho-N-acetylmuramoyl-pentapeptide-transferase